MQNRFTLFKRGKIFYCEDRATGQQKSLQPRDESEAQKIVQAKNDVVTLPQMNLVMAKTYLSAQNPKLITRTWADVMERFCDRSNDSTRLRHERVVRTKPMQFLKPKRLTETAADDFFEALEFGTNSTIAFLQTLHNDALGMGWIPAPILPRKLWPKAKKKDRRAITEAEHVALVAAVEDEEWRLYLKLLWFAEAFLFAVLSGDFGNESRCFLRPSYSACNSGLIGISPAYNLPKACRRPRNSPINSRSTSPELGTRLPGMMTLTA